MVIPRVSKHLEAFLYDWEKHMQQAVAVQGAGVTPNVQLVLQTMEQRTEAIDNFELDIQPHPLDRLITSARPNQCAATVWATHPLLITSYEDVLYPSI
jgi:hypothetical protein